MAVLAFKMLGFFVGFSLMVGLVSPAKFDELFQPSWAQDHLAYEGELLRLKLDSYSAFLQCFHVSSEYILATNAKPVAMALEMVYFSAVQFSSIAADDNAKKCSSSGEKRYWWDEPTLSALNVHQSHQLLWVRANHMTYDYCSDTARFPTTPLECLHHRH
ncbi:hypothetical protein D5086_025158 [Populus alba]|uniref:Uncharacterized protein n=1 Tax=Populus alba TaxID=43335 RepID=A0ACC4B7R1_POPAL